MSIIINGRQINASGRSVSVVNGNVIIDGRRIDVEPASVYNIVVEGNVEEVSGDFAKIEVKGNAESIKTMSGSARVEGAVAGSVSTMSGSVSVRGSVGGSVSTMSGNISK
jgi:hypothetical protein